MLWLCKGEQAPQRRDPEARQKHCFYAANVCCGLVEQVEAECLSQAPVCSPMGSRDFQVLEDNSFCRQYLELPAFAVLLFKNLTLYQLTQPSTALQYVSCLDEHMSCMIMAGKPLLCSVTAAHLAHQPNAAHADCGAHTVAGCLPFQHLSIHLQHGLRTGCLHLRKAALSTSSQSRCKT